MTKDNLINFEDLQKNKVSTTEIIDDTLTSFLKESAQKMLKVAIEQEVNDFINNYKNLKLESGHQRITRNGYLPTRDIQTGIGSISIEQPRVRDKSIQSNNKIKFCSNLIPKYARRTVTLDVMLPILYLKGISTKDFPDILSPLLGENTKNLSPNVISKLKSSWETELKDWQKRDLSDKKYIYFWADGIYLVARSEEAKSCVLVIVGVLEDGTKELVAINDGFRESKQSWRELLLDLQSRNLKYEPKLAIGDGALGFWGAINEIFPKTSHQRCWVHKTCNVLDKLPKSKQPSAKKQLNDIYMADKRADAEKAFDLFIKNHEAAYPKAAECLKKDKEQLLTFYNFPKEHWRHIRTTNPIESTFATVRHRTYKSKGCFSRTTIMTSVFKLLMEAEKRWKKLYCHKKLAEVISLDKFIDGVNEKELKNINKNNLIESAA